MTLFSSFYTEYSRIVHKYLRIGEYTLLKSIHSFIISAQAGHQSFKGLTHLSHLHIEAILSLASFWIVEETWQKPTET